MMPVSPSQLLMGYDIASLPTPSQRDTSTVAQRWKRRLRLKQVYWAAWEKDYKQTLTKFKKWHVSKPDLKEGDIVLVSDNETKRNMWPKGRIETVEVSKDGKVRSVQVRTEKGLLRRAVHQLHPLECGSQQTAFSNCRTESSQAAAADLPT
jgi:hypothetical protein